MWQCYYKRYPNLTAYGYFLEEDSWSIRELHLEGITVKSGFFWRNSEYPTVSRGVYLARFRK